MENKDKNIKDGNQGQELTPTFLRFVSLKTEKLTQSVYLVTSFVTDKEPIKWKLRERALELLSEASVLNPNSVSYDTLSGDIQVSPLFKLSVLESLLDKIDQITGLLDVAVVGGLVSEMNCSILKREYSSLSKLIEEKVGLNALEGNLSYPDNLLVQENFSSLAKAQEPVADISKYRPHPVSASSASLSSKDTSLSAGAKFPVKAGSSMSLKPLKENNKENRQESIVTFLKGKGWTSIKDIADAVPGCSTKTIQRELSDLVQKGVLKKKGDRRWSRYIISD